MAISSFVTDNYEFIFQYPGLIPLSENMNDILPCYATDNFYQKKDMILYKLIMLIMEKYLENY